MMPAYLAPSIKCHSPPPLHPTPTPPQQGGKSPLIVDKNVNVDTAVEDCHFALVFTPGQCGAAGSRT